MKFLHFIDYGHIKPETNAIAITVLKLGFIAFIEGGIFVISDLKRLEGHLDQSNALFW